MMYYRKNSRRNRKVSCKASRKNMRKNSRKNYRRSSRRNNMSMYGGAYDPSNISLSQGKQFSDIHVNQHGGGSWTGAGDGAPVGDQGLLPQELVASARVGPTLSALHEISGMKDPGPGGEVAPGAPQQTGGGRRRKASRSAKRKASRSAKRKASRKASRKGRKASRRMRGGAYASAPAPLSMPTMLLNPAQAAKAGTADFSNPLLKH